MSYRMIALANRFASHWGGGGGTTTTSGEIPEELKPLVSGSVDRMLGLQNYFWGDADEMGSGTPGAAGGAGGTSPGAGDGSVIKADTEAGGGLNIQGEHVRDVVGESAGQQYAGSLLPGLEERTKAEGTAGGAYSDALNMAGRRITGEEVTGDPAISAAYDAFNTFEKPMIEDSATAAGFGRSEQKGDKLSMGLQAMMLPQIQAAQGRAERGLDRDLQSYMQGGQGFQNLGAMETARRTGAINTGMGVGDVQRGVAQEQADAPYEDFIRRAALGESALTGPFGGLVPSTIGSQVTSSGGK